MKKKLFNIIAALILSFCASIVNAQNVPYAELSADGKTLTFKYGEKPEGAYDLNDGEAHPSWEDYGGTVTNVVFDETFADARPTSCYYWFNNMKNLTEIVGMKEYLNTSNVENMAAMFCYCSKLTSIDVSGFDTENVKSMNHMFADCSSITSLNVSNFNTGNVTDMGFMFFECTKLTSLNVGGSFNTENVTNMSSMFQSCYGLTSLDISGFNTGNVTNMYSMFYNCKNLTAIKVGSDWDVSGVTYSPDMFSKCTALIGNKGVWVSSTDKTNANTLSTGYLTSDNYKVFLDPDGGTLTGGNVINVTSEVTLPEPTKSGHQFLGWTRQLTSVTYAASTTTSTTVTVPANSGNRWYKAQWAVVQPYVTYNASTLTFAYGVKPESGDVYDLNEGGVAPGWNVHKTDITTVEFDPTFANVRPSTCYAWFSGMTSLESIIGMKENLNTASVTNMESMFFYCSSLTTLDLSNFNTENVTNMDGMFLECKSLTTILIDESKWTTSNVDGSASYMFLDCISLIGNDGTIFDASKINKYQAHADSDGYLTTGKYKIFYDLDATDNKIEIETVAGATTEYEGGSVVTLPTLTASEENGEFKSWQRTTQDASGNVVLETSTTMIIAANETGNRIYSANWSKERYVYYESSSSTLYFRFDTEKPETNAYSLNEGNTEPDWLVHSGDIENVVIETTLTPSTFYKWFAGCSKLKILDLTNINPTKVTDMTSMFDGCSNLTTILVDADKWDFEVIWNNVAFEKAGNMFAGCNMLIGEDGTWIYPGTVGKTYAFVRDYWGNGGYLTAGKYKIFYDLDDGELNGDEYPEPQEYDDDVDLEIPTKDGCTFLGWARETSEGDFTDPSTTVTVAKNSGNCKFKAVWAVPYVELSSDGKTLTFKVGAKPSGENYFNLNTGKNRPGWYDDAPNITAVVFESSFAEARPTSCYNWFANMYELESITGMKEYLKTDDVKDMQLMFTDCQKLESIDFSSFNTAKVEDMQDMFVGCWLKTLDLSSFNTSSVTNMTNMFYNCSNLTTIIVGEGWKTGSVTTSTNMFKNCSALIGNGGATVGETIDKTYAHANEGGYLTTGDYKIFYQWADEETKTYHEHTPSTFSGSTEVVISAPKRDGHQFLYWTQHSASGTQIGESSSSVIIDEGDLGNRIYQMHWAVVKDYAYLSSDSKTLTFTHGAKPEGVNYFDLNGENTKPAWETAKTMIETVVFASTITPTSCYYWFDGFKNLTTIENLENLHTENVTDMRSMFGSCKKLKKLDLRTFNTANVKYMVYMFQACSELTVLDISSFDTQKAKGTDWWMSSMFWGCTKLTTILIGPKWDAGNANVDIFTGTQELIGNDGTVYSTTKLKYEYAHANAGGLLTTGDYKIFYQWADKPNEYQAYEPSTFNGSVDVTIPNPERDGYKFLYWTRVSPTGAYDGGSSSSLKIAAGDEGNRIYVMHWAVPYAVLSDGGTKLTFKYGEKPASTTDITVYDLNERGVTPDWNVHKTDITTVEFDESFAEARPTTCFSWFIGMTSLNTITGMREYLKTDEVKNMGGMFNGCSGLTSLDLSGFNTAQVTTMSSMFSNCSGLTSLDLSDFNTAQVTTMWYMFQGCRALTTLDISSFDLSTGKIKDMSSMFNGCQNLTAIKVGSGWDVSTVTSHSNMFSSCPALIGNGGAWVGSSKDKTNANTSSTGYLTSGNYKVFLNPDGGTLTDGTVFEPPVTLPEPTKTGSQFLGWTRQLTSATFEASTSTNVTIAADAGNRWYKAHWAVMKPYVVLSDDSKTLTFKCGESIPDGAYSLSSVGWKQNTNITKVVFDETFQYARPTQCSEWFNGLSNLSEIVGMKEYLNTEKVTTMNWMFRDCKNLTALDLSGFKTDIVTKMGAMFYNCENLTVLDLRGFNTEMVTDVGHMFAGCKKLTTVLIGDKWNTDAVTIRGHMFMNCPSLIGNDGTIAPYDEESAVALSHANAEAGGFLTKDDYKIFYKWADDKTGAYQTQYTPSTFNGATAVTINNPSDREYDFLYWTQVSANGTQIGESSTNLTISAGDLGNKIYVMHWRVPQPYAELSSDNKTLTFKYGYKPDGAYDIDEWTSQTIGSKNVDVLGWYTHNESVTKVVFDETFAEARPLSCYNWFYGLTNLKTISGINNLNTSEVSSMRGMFDKCKSLESVDLSHFTTNNLTNIRAMFCDCEKLSTLDLRTLNTGEVTEAQYMFQNCTNLTTILVDDTKWDLSKVTASDNHKGMFQNCTALIGNGGAILGTKIDKTNANTSSTGYLTKENYKIFYQWADESPKTYHEHTPSTFSGSTEVMISEPEREGYKFLYWTQHSASGTQIGGSSSSVTIAEGELGNRIYQMHWVAVQDYAYLSDDRKTLTFTHGVKPEGENYFDLNDGETIPAWSTAKSTVEKVVFESTITPTTCYDWFYEMVNLTTITHLEYLNTENVTSMSSMFSHCQNLTDLDLSGFNTGKVTEMSYMFYGCKNLISLDLSNFKTDNVTDMEGMFDNCSGLTNLNLNRFNTGNVTNMERMFNSCSNLNVLDISSFNTENVTNMEYMFSASAETILIGENWNTEQVTKSDHMFTLCLSLIGNYGLWGAQLETLYDKTYAHANKGGLLTTGKYKIFYLLDNDLQKYYTDENSELKFETFTNSVNEFGGSEVTLVNPEKDNAYFDYWVDLLEYNRSLLGGTAPNHLPTITLSANDVGNRIYIAFWIYPYAVLSEDKKTLTFYFDKEKDSKVGTKYDLNDGETTPAWSSEAGNITKVVFDESFKDARPTSCYYWFNNMKNLTEIVGMKDNLNTSEVKNMQRMFYDCVSLTTIDVSNFNTEKVTTMNTMFRINKTEGGCESLDLRSFNTANVTDMEGMFAENRNLTTILIGSGWTVQGVVDNMASNNTIQYSRNMFVNCNSLIGNDGAKFNSDYRDHTYAHANEGGYLTSGDYKIFYQWADESPKTYHEHTPSTFSGAAAVTLDEPERDGAKFEYWQRVSPSGEAIGESSSTVTIAAGDLGNRIYMANWTIVHTVSFYNGTKFISSVEVPHGEILSDDQFPSPQKTGHILIKWTVTDDPDEYGYGNYAVDEDINLYAQWMKDKFRIILPDHFEYITANNDDDLFEFDSEVQFKISDGYASNNVYYTLGDDTEQFPLTPNSEGVYTYKVKADRAEFYSSTKEFYTMKLGKNASANLPFASNLTINFSSDNSEVSVSNNRIVTTNNVAKGDVCTLTSNNYQIEITIIDPFENFFDEDQWYKEDVVFTCPDNDNNWILTINDSQNNTITQEGENNVVCKILDSDNIIAKESYVVRIDKNPPEISVQVGDYDIDLSIDEPKNYYLRLGAAFSVSAEDETSGVENVQYSLNGVSFNDFDQNITLPYGKSSVYFRSKDVAGNTTQTYSAWFSVFNDSKFAENLGNEITSAPIYYSSEMIEDQTFSISLEGNTIGAITEKNGLNLNFLETDNVIKINKEYLKTLLPGNDTILVHINPLGDSNGWVSDLKPADYESQTMKIILEVKYEVMPSKYSFVMEADTTIKSFCRGDVLLMNMDFDKRYSMVDYISIDKLNINKEVPYEGIKFTVPEGTLSGGDEKIPVKFFKDDYMFENTMIFPANYPSERNIRLYDDVLALDNFDGQFLDGEYKWYMDGVEILGENKQFIDLLPYLNDGKEHIYLASVLNIDSLRFRVCPSDDFIVEQIAKKKAASVRTYPNPAVSNQPIYIELENFSDDDFSNAEIVIYNQLGIVVNRISEVKKINSIVLKDGFYNGTVFLNGVKTLNFKIIAE